MRRPNTRPTASEARTPRSKVVDTNVVIVANRRHGESRQCANNCAQALLNIAKRGLLVLDDQELILREYRRYCSFSGQPGMGDYFFRWIYDNMGRADLVQRVALTVKQEPPHHFNEFPEHEGLSDFDVNDRKFVAVANKHQDKPPIIQATDSKWWGWKEALAQCGIDVEFLCPDEIERAYRRKME